jgi:hypothetical protein
MSNQTTNTGISVYTTIFLIFLILKLTGNISWSWWWVTSPLWIPLLLVLSIMALIFIFGLVYIATTGKNIDQLIKKIQKKD